MIILCMQKDDSWEERYQNAGLMFWQKSIWNEILLENLGGEEK